MKERMFAGRGKNIFAIIATFLYFLEPVLNIHWMEIKYNAAVLMGPISAVSNVAFYMPIIILAVLFTARKSYKLKGTVFSLPFLYLAFINAYGSYVYLSVYNFVINTYTPIEYIVKKAVFALAFLLIFVGSVWRFKLWPLITAGGAVGFAFSVVRMLENGVGFFKKPSFFFDSHFEDYRVKFIEFFITALFFLALAILPLNFKKKTQNAPAESEQETEVSDADVPVQI